MCTPMSVSYEIYDILYDRLYDISVLYTDYTISYYIEPYYVYFHLSSNTFWFKFVAGNVVNGKFNLVNWCLIYISDIKNYSNLTDIDFYFRV